MYIYFSPDTPSEIKIRVENLEFSLYVVNNSVPVYLDGNNQFNYIILRESLEYINAILPESAEEFRKIKQTLGDMYETKQDIILQKEFYEIQEETVVEGDVNQAEDNVNQTEDTLDSGNATDVQENEFKDNAQHAEQIDGSS
ncbi:MAG: hypothetical protein QXF12_04200 [Candidatus Aenigmatarchaeota archaeon]